MRITTALCLAALIAAASASASLASSAAAAAKPRPAVAAASTTPAVPSPSPGSATPAVTSTPYGGDASPDSVGNTAENAVIGIVLAVLGVLVAGLAIGGWYMSRQG